MRGLSRPLRAAGLLSCALLPLAARAIPSINVALQASFSSPPYLLELLETAAEENSTAYFPIVDRIADGYLAQTSTDRELYTTFLQLLQSDGHLVDPDALSSFQFALAVRSTAPRIEAHYQYYNTSVEAPQGDGCDIWVAADGKRYCDAELATPHGSVADGARELPFDRVKDGRSNMELPIVLYADVTNPRFGPFYKELARTVQDRRAPFVLRYVPPPNRDEAQRISVSGYGVEMALKRTDYIVIDDRDAEEARADSEGRESEQDGEVADLKPLSASDVARLGMKAANFVLDSEDPFKTLIDLSQDFPKLSSAVVSHDISEEFKNEHIGNRERLLPPGYNMIWVNGVPVQSRKVDAFSILENIRNERHLVRGLTSLGLEPEEAIKLLMHPEINEVLADEEPQRFDFRDGIEGGGVIMWMNDLENDQRYEGWPSTLASILQRTYPGQLPPVSRDVHNAILPVDFTNPKDVALVVEPLQSFIKRKVPLRWGIVPITNSPAAAVQARIVYHLLESYGLDAMLSYLQRSLASGQISSPEKAHFDPVIAGRSLIEGAVERSFEEVLQHDDVAVKLEGAAKYLDRLSVNFSPAPFIVNGAIVPRSDDWLTSLSNRVSMDHRSIQRGVAENVFEESTWLPTYFLFQAVKRRHPAVVPDDEINVTFANVGAIFTKHKETLDGVLRIPAETKDSDIESWAQMLLCLDFDSENGRRLLSEAIEFRKAHPSVEVLFLPQLAHQFTDGSLIDRMERLRNQQMQPTDALDKIAATLADGATKQTSQSGNKFDEDYVSAISAVSRDLGIESANSGPVVVLNGRIVRVPINGDDFTKDDFETLLSYEKRKRIKPWARALKELGLEAKIKTPSASAIVTSIVAVSSASDEDPDSMFEASPKVRMSAFELWNTTKTAILTGNKKLSTIQIVASIDPSSENAQKFIPILKVLSELKGIHLRLFLNPRDHLSELPIKRFYRYVLQSEPSFQENGELNMAHAQFDGLPAETLLTMGMDVPSNWLVAPRESIHDLDNIKLGALRAYSSIDAIYELEHILIEGHARDFTLRKAPRGAELVLGTQKDPAVTDTIIMANLGYFQFKANPGVFNLALRPGRSSEVYKMDSTGLTGQHRGASDICLTSFQGVTLFPRLSRQPGMEKEDVLEPSTAGSAAVDIADSVLSKAGIHGTKDYINKGLKFGSDLLASAGLSSQGVKPSRHADINIFSVASGHLYERMLNIMMVSVMKHTNHTVKFWFIEQFLSPSFKSFLPTLAAEYGFSYEMVTYKWPHWLRAQKEKQREIWGYKILFLDVLFPLDLDKVIFVDADQIVRTDMYELVTHDLKGAPYGFTPMCDSRTEMEGFRFWKQGYWANFLRGRPYHISALYVVDLVRFRQLAAGDRLRQQYHSLSADPLSLSNLDQDLPNNMQMQLPIHSLPQHWLWCETWCSDESLAEAKTIDLCNNPLTKEPKLDRARRQVPEWTAYDEEIAALARRTKAGNVPVGEDAGSPGTAEAKSDASREKDEL
ncbi:UDP-glucose:Glyco protein glucosyltransferase-domain-containing protein [Lineolata rhizophorae]|uniref:UDP-glucose:Glyco protein glucosyltransferase-domain-containing protein n=1 Tax=Lineolata rhizophorae TaxID=578093 RepID=A0A6A6P042_9PEZI|nr:UDP-glucose:Glyco protein glucosyltransferase-domain-containing protein [Lineolata rhizophorae]